MFLLEWLLLLSRAAKLLFIVFDNDNKVSKCCKQTSSCHGNLQLGGCKVGISDFLSWLILSTDGISDFKCGGAGGHVT